MEPKLPSTERMPNIEPESGEYAAPGQEAQSERRAESSPEKAIERKGEQHHATTSSTPAPISLPTPVQDEPVDDDNSGKSDDDSPLVAADDDLIEKEWVDKAKKIVEDTKDDPHMREKAVGKLQADYLRKRYGKELGETS